MYRIHKASTEYFKALLRRAWAGEAMRECEAEYHAQQSVVLRLEIAKLRRDQRARRQRAV